MVGIIGLKIKFSITKDTYKEGTILDKLIIREKPEDQFSVTGYLVETSEGTKVKSEVVPYWRVREVLK